MRSFAVCSFVLIALVACDGGGETEVRMNDHVFEPATLTISAGETITWVNESDEAHTVTAVKDALPQGAPYFASGRFSSEEVANFADNLSDGLINPGEDYAHQFLKPGTYSYYCIPHRTDQMRGMIVVEE